MSFSRRNLLVRSGALAGYAVLHRLGLAQVGTTTVSMPTTPAAKALFADIGEAAWTELQARLRTVNGTSLRMGCGIFLGLQARC